MRIPWPDLFTNFCAEFSVHVHLELEPHLLKRSLTLISQLKDNRPDYNPLWGRYKRKKRDYTVLGNFYPLGEDSSTVHLNLSFSPRPTLVDDYIHVEDLLSIIEETNNQAMLQGFSDFYFSEEEWISTIQLPMQFSALPRAPFSSVERITLGKEINENEGYSVTFFKTEDEEINIEVECYYSSDVNLDFSRQIFMKCVQFSKLAVERREEGQ